MNELHRRHKLKMSGDGWKRAIKMLREVPNNWYTCHDYDGLPPLMEYDRSLDIPHDDFIMQDVNIERKTL